MQYKKSVFTNFPLYIVPGNGVNLLGRTWLSEIKLDWTSLLNDHKEQVNNVNKSESISGQLEHLVKNYSDIFSDNLGLMKGFKVKINVEPNVSPKFVKARTAHFAMKDVVEAEIDKMEKEGILKSVSFSDWASPIVIVPKPDGNIRICSDYKRTINPVIKNDTYPQPTPEELFSKIQEGKKFSKIDLTKAYLQLELDEESQKFLTINTCKGLKHFTRLPYGVKPASGIFQRVIENALTNISNTAVKIDDILISGRDDSEHLQNIEKVFQVLKDLGVTVNKKKYTFFAKEIEYVGFILDKNGVHVNQNKVKAINELPEPKDLKQLQSFLGGLNYYSKFIPNMTDIAKALYRLIETESEWKWTNIEQSSFEILKQCLLNAPILAMYDKNSPLKVDCDASQYGLGAVLSHVYPDKSEKHSLCKQNIK